MLIQGGAALAQAGVNVPGTTPLQVLQTNSLTAETRYTQPGSTTGTSVVATRAGSPSTPLPGPARSR